MGGGRWEVGGGIVWRWTLIKLVGSWPPPERDWGGNKRDWGGSYCTKTSAKE